MKKLLITGASGFLGSRTLEYYKEKYQITAPSHKEMDITDEENVMEVFRKVRPDYVIHCAAVSDTGRCEREPEPAYKINVEGCKNIAKAAKEVNAKCLICSSDQVYFGKNEGKPHKENEILVPANEYGRGKYKAEQMALSANPDSILLRLAWMYDSKSNSETEHSDFMRTLFSNVKDSIPVSYPVHDVRGITDVREVVENFEKAFSLPGGVYNFGSPNEKNTFETVKKMFELTGLPMELLIENKTAFAGQPRNLSMDQEKLNRYGISFSHTLNALVKNVKLNFR